jgi:hypothetical protein
LSRRGQRFGVLGWGELGLAMDSFGVAGGRWLPGSLHSADPSKLRAGLRAKTARKKKPGRCGRDDSLGMRLWKSPPFERRKGWTTRKVKCKTQVHKSNLGHPAERRSGWCFAEGGLFVFHLNPAVSETAATGWGGFEVAARFGGNGFELANEMVKRFASRLICQCAGASVAACWDLRRPTPERGRCSARPGRAMGL